MRAFLSRTRDNGQSGAGRRQQSGHDEVTRSGSGVRISSPADTFEREADEVADRVMAMPDTTGPWTGPLPSPRTAGGGSSLMAKGLFGGACESAPSAGPEEDERADEPPVMTKREGTAGPQPATWRTPREEGGSALPSHARSFFEPRLGHDFGNVRVHADQDATGMAQSINAAAFTVGNHIYFGDGRFSPATDSGRRLLAHELTHVVQQSPEPGPATPSAPVTISRSPVSRSVLQRFGLNGFPPAEEAAMRVAIPIAVSKVASCSDLSWWGRRMTRLAIDYLRYDYTPQLPECGWTYPGSSYVEIGKSAFNWATCCDLASTIAHEASHTQLYTEGRARRLECKCFGCSC